MKESVYIFLDIDGVLNTHNHLLRQKLDGGKSSTHNWCPNACGNLLSLCREFDADVIISSNWKDQYELEELKEFFEENGISADLIKGMTPQEVERHEGAEFRGREIQRWLDARAAEDVPYVIIDDDSTVSPSQKEHLVQVDPKEGFSDPRALIKARRILMNGR